MVDGVDKKLGFTCCRFDVIKKSGRSGYQNVNVAFHIVSKVLPRINDTFGMEGDGVVVSIFIWKDQDLGQE